MTQHINDQPVSAASGGKNQCSQGNFTEPAALCIQLPKDCMTASELRRFRQILTANAELIKKATGASNLAVLTEDDELCLPWFEICPEQKMIKAVSALITQIIIEARRTEPIILDFPGKNEKEMLRRFLLRLGFSGKDFDENLEILAKNLSDSSAANAEEVK